MSSKAERRAARHTIGSYHEAQLTELLGHVGEAIDKFRTGELDAWDVDEVIFQYSRAAKELWKFCNYTTPEIAARIIEEDSPSGWWEEGKPRRGR